MTTTRWLALVFGGCLLAGACSSSDSVNTASPSSSAGSSAPTTETTETDTSELTETQRGLDEESSTTDPATDPCDAVTKGGTTFELLGGGLSHQVQLYVPTSFDGNPLPVVINWHALGSNGSEQAGLSAYETLAQQEGFIVAHPTGVPAADNTQNGWELAPFDSEDRDDVAFAAALIDDLVDTYCGDPERIYTTGMSNGGFFTAQLVCELSDRIAAAASVAGTTHPEDCEPSRPVPYLSFHGTADEVIGFNGGGSPLMPEDSTPEIIEFFDQVMPDEFAEFAADFGCASEITTEVSDEVQRTDFTECDDDVLLSFYTVAGGGHTWPGSPIGLLFQEALGPTTDDINATELSWEFFSQYRLG